jgi:hypothetical protein
MITANQLNPKKNFKINVKIFGNVEKSSYLCSIRVEGIPPPKLKT